MLARIVDPHDGTLAIMWLMDSARAEVGVVRYAADAGKIRLTVTAVTTTVTGMTYMVMVRRVRRPAIASGVGLASAR